MSDALSARVIVCECPGLAQRKLSEIRSFREQPVVLTTDGH